MEQNNLAILQDWLKYQIHLPSIIDDTILKNFLIGCKSNVEIAKQKIDCYYSFRRQFEEFYLSRDPQSEEIEQSFHTLAYGVLPILTPDGYNVSITKLINTRPDKFEPIAMIKRMLMIGDLRIMTSTLSNGEILIHDCFGLTIQHLGKFNPSILKNYIVVGQARLPMRIKAVILINVPNFMEKLISIIRTFMKDKLKKRLYVYSEDYEQLYNHIPKQIIPRDYGGELNISIAEINELWHNKLLEKRKWFINDAYMMSDESKRMDKTPSHYIENADCFGCDGSFKKLNVD